MNMKTLTKFTITLALSFLAVTGVRAQDLIANVYGREMQSLNGKWDAVVDLYDQGRKNKIYLEPQTRGKNRFLRICVRKRVAAGCSLGLELSDARIEILRRDGLVRPAVRRSAAGWPAAVPPFRGCQLPLPGLSQRRGDREPRGRFHAVPDRGDRQTETGGQFPRPWR